MRYLIIIIAAFLLLLSSCKHTQSVSSNKETVKLGTFVQYREVTRMLPQKDSIVISDPCDSLGIINKFYAQISIPNGKVKIQSKNNHLVASVDVDEAVSVSDSVQSRSAERSTSTVEKVVVKNVIPSWALITIFIETLIIGLYLYFRIAFFK